MKYFIARLEEKNGEQEYNHAILVEARTESSALKKADDSARRWYDSYGGLPKKEKGDSGYWHLDGCIYVEVMFVREIPKEHYEVLKQYM